MTNETKAVNDVYIRLKGCKITASECKVFLTDAESDICRFLRRKTLPTELENKAVQLAVLRAKRHLFASNGLKSSTYTEGSLSKSETYLTEEDFEKSEKNFFESLKTGRKCRIVTYE